MTQELEQVQPSDATVVPSTLGGYRKPLMIAGAACALAALWFVAPEQSTNAASEAFRRANKNAGVLCLDYERKSLKDPESARLLSQSSTGDGPVTIEYKAKNSYGAYGRREAQCYISGGVVSEGLTESRRAVAEGEELFAGLREETATIKAQVDCLRKNKKALSEGIAPDTLLDCNDIKSPSGRRF